MLPVARDDGKTCLPVRSPKKKTPHGGACRLNPDILRPAVLAVRKLSLVVIHASCALSVVGKTTQALRTGTVPNAGRPCKPFPTTASAFASGQRGASGSESGDT